MKTDHALNGHAGRRARAALAAAILVSGLVATAGPASSHHVPPPAPQRFTQCKPIFQVERRALGRAEARIAARNAWRAGIQSRYGSRFTDWKYAAHNRTKCKRINLTVRYSGEREPDRFICQAIAYPCAPWSGIYQMAPSN